MAKESSYIVKSLLHFCFIMIMSWCFIQLTRALYHFTNGSPSTFEHRSCCQCEKISLSSQSVRFLGYFISSENAMPTTRKQLQTFLGFIGNTDVFSKVFYLQYYLTIVSPTHSQSSMDV